MGRIIFFKKLISAENSWSKFVDLGSTFCLLSLEDWAVGKPCTPATEEHITNVLSYLTLRLFFSFGSRIVTSRTGLAPFRKFTVTPLRNAAVQLWPLILGQRKCDITSSLIGLHRIYSETFGACQQNYFTLSRLFNFRYKNERSVAGFLQRWLVDLSFRVLVLNTIDKIKTN